MSDSVRMPGWVERAKHVHWSMYPLVLLLAIVASLVVPNFAAPDNLRNIIEQSGVLAVLTAAEVLVLLTGRFDLSLESIVGFAPMAAAVLVTKAAIPSSLGIPIAIIVGALVGFVNGFLIVKVHLQPFIATLGMLTLLRGAMMIISSGKAVYNTGDLDGMMWFGQTRIAGVLAATWLAIAIVVLLAILTTRHRFGRALYAIGGNESASRAAGIPVDRTLWLVYIVAGALAGAAGLMLSGRLNSIPLSQGDGMIFDVFAAAVIGGVALTGGKGSIYGAVSGVLLLGIVSNLLTLANVSSYWVQATRGAIILIAMIIASVAEVRRRRGVVTRDTTPSIRTGNGVSSSTNIRESA
ncbi:MAG: ATPase [Subtercola sp.]|nr:ATPase [Subtercola sp.]